MEGQALQHRRRAPPPRRAIGARPKHSLPPSGSSAWHHPVSAPCSSCPHSMCCWSLGTACRTQARSCSGSVTMRGCGVVLTVRIRIVCKNSFLPAQGGDLPPKNANFQPHALRTRDFCPPPDLNTLVLHGASLFFGASVASVLDCFFLSVLWTAIPESN